MVYVQNTNVGNINKLILHSFSVWLSSTGDSKGREKMLHNLNKLHNTYSQHQKIKTAHS